MKISISIRSLNFSKRMDSLILSLSHRFRSKNRIKLKRDFDRIYQEGVVASDSILVIHALKNELGFPRIGLSVGKRVGSSPVRNQWKRWMRESFRLQQELFPQNVDFIVRPKREAQGSFDSISQSMRKLAHQIDRKLNR